MVVATVRLACFAADKGHLDRIPFSGARGDRAYLVFLIL